jgi:hypothetical protein
MQAEIRRAKKANGPVMWPMQWQNGVCTGVPLNLFRSSKTERFDGTKNKNYGRWYFALRVPVMHNGQPVMNSGGFPETRLDCFTWLDESNYVRTNALHAVLQHAKGGEFQLVGPYGNALKPEDYWRKDLSTIVSQINHTFR